MLSLHFIRPPITNAVYLQVLSLIHYPLYVPIINLAAELHLLEPHSYLPCLVTNSAARI